MMELLDGPTDESVAAAPPAPSPYLTLFLYTCAILLAWCGLERLLLPPIYRLADTSLFSRYEGHLLLTTALLLVVFRHLLLDRIHWLARELHRLVTALLVMGALGVDAMMHLFNIPHLEGWWLPLIGSGAAAGIIRKLRKH